MKISSKFQCNPLFLLAQILFLIVGGCATPPPQTHIDMPVHSDKPVTETRKSIIIYPPEFAEAARRFAYLHREFGGTEAILVSLDTVRSMGVNSDFTIPFEGWENKRPTKIRIKKYDFQLAKQIIGYLRKREKETDLMAVLLLGDAAHIPPSYYFHTPYLKTMQLEDIPYNEWIASDILYGSPDLDFRHEWAVGRISVDTPDQASLVAEKYYRWSMANREQHDKSFIYFAGNIRKDTVYSGELLYLMLEGEGVVGSNGIHYFESDNRYTIDHLEESFRADEGYLHYIFSHGSGDGFEIDGDYLRSDELAAMPFKKGLPLVVSSSCLDGGFDYDLIDVPHDDDGYSIGEAILRAPGAGIGYLGSSRVSLGQFHYSMRDGEISPQHMYYRYMPGLLFAFLKAYHSGTHRLADAYVEAHERYIENFGIDDPKDFATFVELNLLADPVVILPEPATHVASKLPHLEIISRHEFRQARVLVPLHEVVHYRLSSASPHNEARTIITNVRTGHVLLQKAVTRTSDLQFVVPQKGSFILRVDLPDGTVNWEYFQSDKI